MKAQLVLFIIGLMGSLLHAENMFSQTLISLHVNNVDIETLFSEIESKTGYVVLYRESSRLKKTVSVNATDKNLEEVLSEALTPHGLKYHVSGKQIVITEDRSAPVAPPAPRQEKRQVTGVVTDANGEPLIGANVLEVGTGNGTITDIEGAYSLSVSSGARLQFTYISYKTVEIAVGIKSVVNVVLEEDASALDELIVVGYGVQRKSDVTGALSRVTESQIKDRPVQNALQAM
ncbi:MAG: carboxypeptidase-like regulatory domain-containing protein [Bacteroides sp.]|nr:carboxypeptidase-like regulatory domain-containing protein [Bacteroides sp.]